MSEDAFAEGVALGRRNNEAKEYIRRHCRHARVEQPTGNSPVGRALGLTLGLLEIRCEHAPTPRQLGSDALDLAVGFYDANCRGCAFRDGSGELPNLATIAAERRREAEARAAEDAQRAQERAARYHARLHRRRQLVAGESYLVRDVADWLDRIDVEEPRERDLDASEREAARLLLETAHHAPDLFNLPLIDTLVDLAKDSAEPSAFAVLAVLARAGRLPARTLIEAALAVLPEHAVAEAARALREFSDQLQPRDLPPVLDRLVAMAAGTYDHWRPAPEVDGFLAAAEIDLPAITDHLILCLQSEDDRRRADAAEAAGLLLTADPTRLVALGPPLVGSVRSKDQGYAGTPSPTAEATRALAEAWRGAPVVTSGIIESYGRTRPQEARAELMWTIHFLRRWREPLDASSEAVDEAVGFCLRRMGGDWGAEVADRATEELKTLCENAIAHVVPHIDTVIGHLLDLCVPHQKSPLLQIPELHVRDRLAALNQFADDTRQRHRQRTVARIIGMLAKASPTTVLDRVLPLFKAESGTADQDRIIRCLLLLALEESVSPHLLRDVLPALYSALLSPDQVIRADAIQLWEACARVAGPTMPNDFAYLAQVMLRDQYVIVHKAMLRALPRLRLPDSTAPALLPVVAAWARIYHKEPDVLDDALWSLRYLIRRYDDEQTRQDHNVFALSLADHLSPYDRERFLLAEWPEQLRADPVWSRPALHALASAEMTDMFDRKGDDLFAALLDQPRPLQAVPYEDFTAVADAYLPEMPWRAIEMVELLQAAGRWGDATALATRAHERAAQGREGEVARSLASAVLAHCRLSEAVTTQAPTVGDDRLTSLLQAIRTTTTALESAVTDAAPNSSTHRLVAVSRAYADAIASLLVEATSDPDQVAAVLDQAAATIEVCNHQPRAADRQRQWYSQGLRIAAALRRFDGAVRRADSDALRFRDAAQRQAEVLGARVAESAVPSLPAWQDFCALLATLSGARDVVPACAMFATIGLPVLLVHIQGSPQRPLVTSTTDSPIDDTPLVVTVFSMHGVPVTDVLVLRPTEVYHLGVSLRLAEWPHWADRCDVHLLTFLDRSVLTVPSFTFRPEDVVKDTGGCLLTGEQPLHCAAEQPIRDPAIDCPLLVRFSGSGREQQALMGGYRRLRLRPFDPSRDQLTDHEQTDTRLLAMYETIADPQFDAEDARAFCRIFSACVRAAQSIMFDKVFRRGQRVTEAQFHDELERRLRADSQLEGRLTRRDAVAGGLDDLLHDDVIVELKVARTKAVTVDDCAKYLGQPTQYGVGRGSQLSVLVVLDHSNKTSPPGVLENYVGWLKPRLHGLDDPRYPSLVGVLIVNTNLPLPSTWSRKTITTAPPP